MPLFFIGGGGGGGGGVEEEEVIVIGWIVDRSVDRSRSVVVQLSAQPLHTVTVETFGTRAR